MILHPYFYPLLDLTFLKSTGLLREPGISIINDEEGGYGCKKTIKEVLGVQYGCKLQVKNEIRRDYERHESAPRGYVSLPGVVSFWAV